MGAAAAPDQSSPGRYLLATVTSPGTGPVAEGRGSCVPILEARLAREHRAPGRR
jgi:hypothetical protein